MNIHQRRDPVVKLTSVSIYANGVTRSYFLPLQHNEKGQAILPRSTLDALLAKRGVKIGDTVTIA